MLPYTDIPDASFRYIRVFYKGLEPVNVGSLSGRSIAIIIPTIFALLMQREHEPVALLVSPAKMTEVDSAFQARRRISSQHYDVNCEMRRQLTLHIYGDARRTRKKQSACSRSTLYMPQATSSLFCPPSYAFHNNTKVEKAIFRLIDKNLTMTTSENDFRNKCDVST